MRCRLPVHRRVVFATASRAAAPGSVVQSFCNHASQLSHSWAFLRRKALLMTETELMLIAAPAMIGLSNKPQNG